MKRILRYIVWALLGFVIAMLLLPVIFQDKFIEAIEGELSSLVDANIKFESGNLSLFRSFPDISAQLNNIEVTGIGDFDSITLLKIEQLDFSTNWKSIIRPRQGITLTGVDMFRPNLNLIINQESKANYDIFKKNEDKNSNSFFGKINKYKLTEGHIDYKDNSSNLKMNFEDINHEGKGNFKDVQFDLITATTVDKTNIIYKGISYIKDAPIIGKVDIGIDLDENLYHLNKNNISVNDLDFSLIGDIKILKNAYNIDLILDAPNNKVSSILSMIPNVYSKDFKNVESGGNGSLKGTIKGVLDNNNNRLPLIDLNINIDQGWIKYPDLGIPLDNINLRSELKTSRPDWKDMGINFSSFVFQILEDKVMGRLSISNIYDNPKYDGQLIGKIDLEKLVKVFPIEEIELRSGKIETDIKIKADNNSILTKDYKSIGFDGFIKLTDIHLSGLHNNPIKIDLLSAKLSPEKMQGSILNSSIGHSDINGDFEIENPLFLLTKEKRPQLRLKATGHSLDLDELLNHPSAQTNDTPKSDEISVPLDLAIDYHVDNVIYDDLNLEKLILKGSYADDEIKLDNANVTLDKRKISAKGNIRNVMAYLMDSEILEGDIYMSAQYLDLNQFVSESGASAGSKIIDVPKFLNLNIYPEIEQLKFTDYSFHNFDGKLTISDQTIALTNAGANLFKGRILLDGAYNSKDISSPFFDFKFQTSEIEFSEFFKSSKTFRSLAPIAEYIEGIFNSTLVISGPLKESLLPDLYKISASGYIETIKGKIAGFKPLEVLGAGLGIDKLKNWDIKDSKNWFDVNEGVISIKEQDYKIEDMYFKVAGNHSLDQQINYSIKAIIPRDKLKKGQIGSEFDSSLSHIEELAKKKGINIGLGKNIYLQINLTGNLHNPQLSIVPTGSGGDSIEDLVKQEAKNKIKEARDKLESKIETKKDEVTDSVNKVITKEIDKLKSQAEEKVDKEIDKIKDVFKDKLETKIDSITKGKVDSVTVKIENKVKDVLGGKAQSEIDSIKSKLKDWNPFEKKKK